MKTTCPCPLALPVWGVLSTRISQSSSCSSSSKSVSLDGATVAPTPVCPEEALPEPSSVPSDSSWTVCPCAPFALPPSPISADSTASFPGAVLPVRIAAPIPTATIPAPRTSTQPAASAAVRTETEYFPSRIRFPFFFSFFPVYRASVSSRTLWIRSSFFTASPRMMASDTAGLTFDPNSSGRFRPSEKSRSMAGSGTFPVSIL